MMHTIDGIEIADKLAPLNPNRTPNVALMSSDEANDWRMHSASYRYTLPMRGNKNSPGMESFATHYGNIPWRIALEANPSKIDPGWKVFKNSNGTATYTNDRLGQSVDRTADEIAIDARCTKKEAQDFLDSLPDQPTELDEMEKQNKGLRENVRLLRKKMMLEGPIASAKVDKDVTRMVTDVTPLSIGKLYEVVFKEGKETASIKVAIRLMAKQVPTSTIVSIMSINSPMKTDMIERFHGVRSGELEFINHFLFCNDLIDEHRKALLKDKTGLYKEIANRRNKSMLAGLLERNPSVAVASNLAIIDSGTLEEVEMRMGGNFKSDRIRSEVFATTSLMILAVVDRGYDRIRFYHRGIDQYSDLSVRDIKANSRDGGGGQVVDIMKAFLKGSAPQI
jgi:hypothetical protein